MILDGYVDEAQGIHYIGEASQLPNGKWVCLANVRGALCRVEVSIKPLTRYAILSFGGLNVGDDS
jgi:hypothetical protein